MGYANQLLAGPAGANGASGADSPYIDPAAYANGSAVTITETTATVRTIGYQIALSPTIPANYSWSCTGAKICVKYAGSVTITVSLWNAAGTRLASKTQAHTGSASKATYTVTFTTPQTLTADGGAYYVTVYNATGYNTIVVNADTVRFPNTFTTGQLGGPGWWYTDVKSIVADAKPDVQMGSGSMQGITPLITATPI